MTLYVASLVSLHVVSLHLLPSLRYSIITIIIVLNQISYFEKHNILYGDFIHSGLSTLL